jgi:hypothetical protein
VTEELSALTFENADLNITSGFAAGNGAVFRSETSTQPVIFNGCSFKQAVTTSAAGVLEIDSSKNLTFNDCTFIQSGLGKVLTIVGASACNIKFKNCKFYSSNLTALSQEFYVACGEVDAPPVVFEDCVVYLRRSSNSVAYRMEINGLNGADVATANGSISVDGLKVILDYTGSTSPNMFSVNSHSTLSYGSTLAFKNLSFYFNSNSLKAASSQVIRFATTGAPSFVDNLQLYEVTEPQTPATTYTCKLVYLNNAHVVGGANYSSSTGAGSLAWDSLFELDVGSTLTSFDFHSNNSTVVYGRCIRIVGSRASVRKCRAVVDEVHPDEGSAGWFCNIGTDLDSCTVEGNQIRISSDVGSLGGLGPTFAVIGINSSTSNFGRHKVLGNSFSVNGAVSFIYVSGSSYNNVSNNTYDQITGGAIDAIFLGGNFNTVFGMVELTLTANLPPFPTPIA